MAKVCQLSGITISNRVYLFCSDSKSRVKLSTMRRWSRVSVVWLGEAVDSGLSTPVTIQFGLVFVMLQNSSS